ncbi:heterokaryon incompatibility protein-domain-containing protein [Clohesyomyces aquaticus]|uniref:Heterokaryon incompatibility protein-domain-containing protein n=1 Tax=Clohesyomyces aquaticus TaxID=1231657 RepID=A0A1Y1ZLX9_9PLEO|nr:heterokaryon incompatibility protein-domain-containing protein [Clohesyomyces aquaticus]
MTVDTSPPTSTETKKPYKLKIPKSLRSVANLSELEIDLSGVSGGDISIVSDTRKKGRKEGLCTACSKIDYEHLVHPADPDSGDKFTRKLIFLDRIIRKKKRSSCHFCSLLFDAIAENDPFEHPAVKNHLPEKLVGLTFKKWAENLDFTQHLPLFKGSYPFGSSRDGSKIQQEVQGEEVVVSGIADSDQEAIEEAAKFTNVGTSVAITAGVWAETDIERVKIMATVGTVIPTVTSLMTKLESELPVAVSIIVHKDRPGLLNVDVWGYGNAHRAPLSRLSSFNLRIASGYQRLSDGLSYGKLLRPEIDVEGDCRLWIEDCFGHHGQACDQPGWWNGLPPPSGPHFRLIDVNNMRVVQKDIGNLHEHDKPRYAALSYVWGAAGKQCLNLHMRNLQDLSTSVEGQPLPVAKTIRDAIVVTRRMGLQYIWVDSLCIIQYDDHGEDDADARLDQIQQMDRIFGHAAVTIVAADGLDAEAGLSGISTRPLRTQVAREIQPGINVLLAVQYNNAYGKWDTRAWTLQEKLLSKRMLIFNGGYSLIKRNWDGTPMLLRSPFFSEYASLLAQYTSRDMTNSGDALNAVLEYTLNGLPEESLDLALLWQPPAAKGVHLTKRANDDLPSWSWTGWEVSKDPEFNPVTANTFHAKPGVRFEEPFWVATNDDLALKKLPEVEDVPEERFKPLIMWYKPIQPSSTSPITLVPVNGHGIGLALRPADAETLHQFLTDAIRLRTGGVGGGREPGPPTLHPDIPLSTRHLICETQMASFKIRNLKLRQEDLYKRTPKGLTISTSLYIPEAEIVDPVSDKVVGRFVPTDPRKGLSSGLHSFILLSESQYWGDEKRVDVAGLPLFNVMCVEWDTRGEFATRVGLGKVRKGDWWAARPELRPVILK